MADNVAKQMLLAQEERAKGRFAAGAFWSQSFWSWSASLPQDSIACSEFCNTFLIVDVNNSVWKNKL